MTAKDLKANEYSPYYQTYIDNTAALRLDSMRQNFDHQLAFLQDIPAEKQAYRYAADKWTVKEVVLHMIDTERIFAYRALRIARQDKTPLAGFDQDQYVAPSKANERTLNSLLKEYITVKSGTITLFESFDHQMLMQIGTASDFPISVRALGFIIMGHENHHCDVLRERYL
ncbi:MAG TPA: DinB family protein [Aquaticitalea sp.]|nr:DinB family protein [Aquaticitalea sp.]